MHADRTAGTAVAGTARGMRAACAGQSVVLPYAGQQREAPGGAGQLLTFKALCKTYDASAGAGSPVM